MKVNINGNLVELKEIENIIGILGYCNPMRISSISLPKSNNASNEHKYLYECIFCGVFTGMDHDDSCIYLKSKIMLWPDDLDKKAY